ncbi:MAG: methionyl-tRNA formyltransferase [Gammaproteobacteria bacterium]
MSGTALRLAFAGTPGLAATILQALIEEGSYEVTLVYSQPDRPAGRGRKTSISAVKQLAEANRIPVRQPASATDIDKTGELMDTDLLIVVAYGLLLPAEILNRPKMGSINVHFSLLPRWRGAAPVQRAIEAGDRETGITIMRMDAGFDTGDILLQRTCPIRHDDTAGLLQERLAPLASQCLLEALPDIVAETIKPRKQDESQATYAHKTTKDEALINWSRPAMELERMVRAFNPFPVAHTELNGQKMRILKAQVLEGPRCALPPGSVVPVPHNGMAVVTGDQLLGILTLQLPGKTLVQTPDFLNGHPDFMRDRQ